jgi:predicted DCC family thiol-disulfide oxidoreductase YuxK
MRPLRIVYDGDCPFCSRYVRLVRLRDNFDVELVDARADPETARRYGLDLNEGMIVDLDGAVHHGSDAVWILSQLSSRSGVWNRTLAGAFSSRFAARLLYPVMRLGRWATLLLLGKRPL